jgi:DNA-binding NtrC family response regulator
VPLGIQVKLLRVLQNRTVERVGGIRTIPINVRVIAGTKRDLKQMVVEGKFREDLFYRLNVLPVSLPPLRERPEDIPVLMDHFLRRFFRRKNEDVPPVSDAVMQAFTRYNWPGNVRELENACERIAQTCSCGAIRIGCVAASILFGAAGQPPRAFTTDTGDAPAVEPALPFAPPHDHDATPAVPPAPAPAFSPAPAGLVPVPISLDDRVREFESSLIRWALRATHGNKSRAAALLQIKRSTLGDRIVRCGLEAPAAETTPMQAAG